MHYIIKSGINEGRCCELLFEDKKTGNAKILLGKNILVEHMKNLRENKFKKYFKFDTKRQEYRANG